MRLALVAVLADEAGQAQVAGLQVEPDLLRRFAAGARIGGFASEGVELRTGRPPATEVGLLATSHQQDLILRSETVKQRRDLVRQGHRAHRTNPVSTARVPQ